MSIVLSEILAGKQTVALGGHVRPDGDCVGSVMGLYLYLKEQYPELQVDVYLENIAERFRFIQDTDVIRSEIDPSKVYDLFICMDCGDKERLGFSARLFDQAKKTACIDHHVSNEAFANDNEIVPDASSTSELVYRLIEKDKISLHCAEALYMGIAHDTGVFQYSCTAPETMEAAAELLRRGVNGSDIIDKTFYEKTYVQNQILGKALLESMMILDKKCIFSYVSRRDLEFFNAVPSDLEGIVSQLRYTAGTEVAIFMYETGYQEYKVSLRSGDAVDVSRIAKYFGGGGHVKAAGCTMKGTVHDVVNNLTKEIDIQLNGADVEEQAE